MNLVVDIGNSRFKWAQVGTDTWRPGASIALTDGIESLLDSQWASLDTPSSILISNVSGKSNAASINAWVRKRWNKDTTFFQSGTSFRGMVNGYQQPEQLGCDRWAALIGARAITASGALCVVDCGTAITVDVVNADNRFIGGVILPGIDLMQDSLLNNTSDILESRAEFKQVIGTTTAQCVASGSYFGSAGAIDRVVREACSITGEAKLYITGGDAPQLLPLLSNSLQHEPNLVLIGLAYTLK